MFRNYGKPRTLNHNLKIASLLSFIAGIVNVAGFSAVQRLTANVTGHFTTLVDKVFKLDFWEGFVYFLYIFSFLFGSFVSSIITEIISRRGKNYIYVIPAFIECIILFTLGFCGEHIIDINADVIAFGLLFAMGLQNALVTTITNAAVRTTHLTGLFTDLGIELSRLFFFKMKDQREKLVSSIKLRLTIISFFFSGGILGCIFYSKFELYVLILAGAVLLMGLIYDNIKHRYILSKQQYKSHSSIS